MTRNKRTIEKYMDGFRRNDHAQILSCLTEDVEWHIPGSVHLVGREAFDREIENPEFQGSPAITIERVIEEDDVVVAEGAVQARKRSGGILHLVFCDVFVMENGKIKQLTSYLMEDK